MSERAVPVGGPIVTPAFRWLLLVCGVGVIMAAWRFLAGLGPVTALSDGYPWGIWIAFDVVVGTALGCGGYAMAILVYIFNKGKYHALVRPAVLTSALGYSLAAVAIVIDVGRYWNIWKLPFAWRWWNLSSALLEVALCVMAYVIVLWIEMSPVFLEQWKEGKTGLLRNLAVALSPILDKALLWILALGLLLPTMHQSSLGSVMLLAHQKLHPLWHTPLLPLLFLVSCIAMGYGVVVLESTLSSRAFKRRDETPMLASLGGVTSALLLAYVAIRLVDLALRGRVGLIFASGWLSFFFLLEMALFLVPAVMLLSPRWCTNAGNLFRAGMLVVLAGSLYRFTTYLIAFNPGPGWSYFPAVPEMLVTFGIVAFEIMVYIVLVKRFPILAGAPQGAAAR
jgi:Ni/Fe-hydrogenase subunit HybB-like protein